MRAWLRTAGELPCNVKVLVEGEEEIGSPGLAGFLDAHVDELRSDVLLLADAGNWSVGTPGLTYSLRGLAGVDVRVRALDGPVHSGMAGGAVPDPVLALAQLLATLVDEHGDPAFDGCWDDYEPPDAAERARLDALPRNDDGLRRAWGVRDGVELAGDPDDVDLRAPLAAPDGHRHRHRRPPDRGIVEPDRGRGRGARQRARRSRPGSRRASTTRCARTSNARVPFGLELTITALDAVPAWHCEPDRLGVRRHRARAARRVRRRPRVHGRRRHASRSSVRSPTRSAASPRCSSGPPIPAAASTARTRASTSATGTSSSRARCACSPSSPADSAEDP